MAFEWLDKIEPEFETIFITTKYAQNGKPETRLKDIER